MRSLRFPLAALEEAARECFRQLRGVPHLVVRVNEALVETADAVMQRVAREHGFAGAIVVLGDPTSRPATCASNGPTAASSATAHGSRRPIAEVVERASSAQTAALTG